tara:strand:+ start:46 stop:270 length:225 start_codon:yes stop_codon:yes gene_type:complete
MAKCGKKCEVYSRVTGYLRPVDRWNIGKRKEYIDRKEFCESVSIASNFAVEDVPTLVKPTVQQTLGNKKEVVAS